MKNFLKKLLNQTKHNHTSLVTFGLLLELGYMFLLIRSPIFVNFPQNQNFWKTWGINISTALQYTFLLFYLFGIYFLAYRTARAKNFQSGLRGKHLWNDSRQLI